MNEGYLKGERCYRNGCEGVIKEYDSDSCCSCHINPPCSFCTTSRAYCETCGWDGRDEQLQHEKAITEHYQQTEYPGLSVYHSKDGMTYRDRVFKMMSGELSRPNCLMWIDQGHTHFSMIKTGVFPQGMTREELLKEVKGTFGGRFERYDPQTGVFKYIAYTD